MLTQSVTLLEPIGATEGVVVSGVPAYAGHGRAHGGGTVTDDDGRLLATFQTTGVLRGPPPRACRGGLPYDQKDVLGRWNGDLAGRQRE